MYTVIGLTVLSLYLLLNGGGHPKPGTIATEGYEFTVLHFCPTTNGTVHKVDNHHNLTTVM
jgi:hypothetical protein